MKSDGSFLKSDGSFCEKWQVVLPKTTGRFMKSDEFFSTNVRMQKKGSMNHSSKTEFFDMWKYLQSPSLTRTRTRASQEFLLFCCHKCHSAHHNKLYIKLLHHIHKYILTNNPFPHSNKVDNTLKNLHFLSTFSSISGFYFPPLWHLWQQKINISVGRRAHTHVREEENHYTSNLLSIPHKTESKKNILLIFPSLRTFRPLYQ